MYYVSYSNHVGVTIETRLSNTFAYNFTIPNTAVTNIKQFYSTFWSNRKWFFCSHSSFNKWYALLPLSAKHNFWNCFAYCVQNFNYHNFYGCILIFLLSTTQKLYTHRGSRAAITVLNLILSHWKLVLELTH